MRGFKLKHESYQDDLRKELFNCFPNGCIYSKMKELQADARSTLLSSVPSKFHDVINCPFFHLISHPLPLGWCHRLETAPKILRFLHSEALKLSQLGNGLTFIGSPFITLGKKPFLDWPLHQRERYSIIPMKVT